MTRPGERPAPPLARTTLDRAGHRRRDAAWLAAAWPGALVLVVDKSGRALVRGHHLVLLDAAATPEVPAGERLFLGIEPDGTPVFTVSADLPEVEGAEAVNLRDIGHLLDDRDAGLFTVAAALINWHAVHGFSPRTGRATRPVDGGWARSDPDGGLMWPRTDPAMIVLVHDGVAGPGGRCLLGHNVTWPAVPGIRRFSCLAGYVEPGESAESSVVREVQEEVGVALTSIRYEGSQAWPFPCSLMLGFSAVADPALPVRVDPEEIDEARWFTRIQIAQMIDDELADPDTGVVMRLPMRASIAFFLIETWLSGPPHGPA